MDAVEKVLFGFGLSDTVIEVSRITLAGQVIALHDTPTHQGSIGVRQSTLHHALWFEMEKVMWCTGTMLE